MNNKDFIINQNELNLKFTYETPLRKLKIDYDDFTCWQEKAREKLEELLRIYPMYNYGKVKQLRQMKFESYTIKAMVMETENLDLTAYLLEPDKPLDLPPVVAVQGHGSVLDVIGFIDDYHKSFGKVLAETGRTVLAVELRGFEALVDLAKQLPNKRLDYGNWGSHMAFSLVTDAFLKGRTLIGDTVSDIMAWAKWLMQYANKDSYDAAGISYGGDCVLCLGAIDLHMRKAFISGSFGSFEPIFDTCYNLPAHCIPDILNWLDRADIAALIAPRCTMFHFGELDVPSDNNNSASYNHTVEPAFNEVKEVYDYLGAGRVHLAVSKGLGHVMDNELLVEFLNER